MAADAMVFANEALFNLLLSSYLEANPGALTGIYTAAELGIEIVVSSNGAPTTALTPRADGRNVGILVPLLVSVFHLNKLQTSVNVDVLVWATLALDGQTLRLTDLEATGPGGVLDRKAADIFNDRVLPSLRSAFASVPLPDLTKVIGVPVQVQDVQVVNRQVAVSARVGNGSGRLEIVPAAPDYPAVTAAIS